MGDTTFSDTYILDRIRQGDQKSFDRLYQHYWEILYRSAYSRIKSHDLAEDIVQEVFMDIWKRRSTLKIKGSIKVYLLTAVKYHIFKLVQEMHLHEELDLAKLSLSRLQENTVELDDIYQLIEHSLEKLPSSHAAIFQMHRMEGMSIPEVSDALQMAPQTIYNALSRITKQLKNELKGYYTLFL
ncbi:RNA polymerase sigma factor [Echinicola pacifica]|nr:sigma-70 family RNA polymerase sigma factor [Echinicola pacifica]